MERLFNLDPQLLHDAILLAINVFVLCVLLSYLLFNPVRKVLADRKAKVKNDLEAAAKAREDGSAFKEEYEAKLEKADQEVDLILAEARKRAVKSENDIIADAKEEASRIMQHAANEAELEKKKVVDDVKTEVISVASAMAGKLVSAQMDEEAQEALLEETLKEMGDDTWLN